MCGGVCESLLPFIQLDKLWIRLMTEKEMDLMTKIHENPGVLMSSESWTIYRPCIFRLFGLGMAWNVMSAVLEENKSTGFSSLCFTCFRVTAPGVLLPPPVGRAPHTADNHSVAGRLWWGGRGEGGGGLVSDQRLHQELMSGRSRRNHLLLTHYKSLFLRDLLHGLKSHEVLGRSSSADHWFSWYLGKSGNKCKYGFDIWLRMTSDLSFHNNTDDLTAARRDWRCSL